MTRGCEGRVALVTGASQGGTGTVAAVRLAAEGAAVAITARSVDGLERTRAEIASVGGTALVLPCDLGNRDGGRDTLVARTEAELGPVDILVNNAAAGGYRPLEHWGQADLDQVMELNLFAPWSLMRQALPGMRERGRGWIVNLTSFAAELPPGPPFPTNRPAKTGSAYGASKAALNRLTIAAASETEGQSIAVNALTPQAAIAVPSLVAAGWIDETYFEPVDTMAQAVLALSTCSPTRFHGRIAYSLQLLHELGEPVLDTHGEQLVDGWQPADLPARIARQAATMTETAGWPSPFSFRRPSSPDFAPEDSPT
jgi:NAD(P)-dependent dehydrogenase (short-subunit alcohol dehydrogenase family)